MKRLSLGVAAALLLSAGPAAADGLPSKGQVRAPAAEAPFSWRGFYAGLHAGLATGNTQGEIGPFSSDYEMNGALYGAQVGYLGQWGNVVAGIEGTYSGSNVQGSDAGCLVFIVGVDCRRDVNWLATVVGRAGIAYDRVLLYGLGGVAWADVDTDIRILNQPFLSGGDTHVGWTAGFGVEWALSNRVSARIEYAHIDLGRENQSLNFAGYGGEVPSFAEGDGSGRIRDRVDLQMDTVRLGINIKLGDHN
jgi:outer membrane immunogenic protein